MAGLRYRLGSRAECLLGAFIEEALHRSAVEGLRAEEKLSAPGGLAEYPLAAAPKPRRPMDGRCHLVHPPPHAGGNCQERLPRALKAPQESDSRVVTQKLFVTSLPGQDHL